MDNNKNINHFDKQRDGNDGSSIMNPLNHKNEKRHNGMVTKATFDSLDHQNQLFLTSNAARENGIPLQNTVKTNIDKRNESQNNNDNVNFYNDNCYAREQIIYDEKSAIDPTSSNEYSEETVPKIIIMPSQVPHESHPQKNGVNILKIELETINKDNNKQQELDEFFQMTCNTERVALPYNYTKDQKSENDFKNGQNVTFNQTKSHKKYQENEVKGTLLSMGEPPREQWSKKIDFLLSIIGFAVDLANVWRFPYLCYKNGGGAFLIPYVIMLVFAGIPLLYLELALGQYNQAGAVGIWKMLPYFRGVGYASITVSFYVSIYYPVIIGYAFYYLFSSFTTVLPWSTCDNAWNTKDCFEKTVSSQFLRAYHNGTLNLTNNLSFNTSYYNPNNMNISHFNILQQNVSKIIGDAKTQRQFVPASEEFFNRKVLGIHESQGLDFFGGIKWDICLAAILIYLCVFFSLIRGVKSSGKVVWVTATLPYILLLVLLIQSFFLPGAKDGVFYYLRPNIEKLKDGLVWFDAAVQIFYSTGPGFGVHIAYASYNKFHNNIQSDAIVTACVNSVTSFLAGIVVFSFLGHLAQQRGLDIQMVAQDGPGLVFNVYPEALTLLKGSVFFSIVFFLTLITLGFDSLLGGVESVITGLYDDLHGWMAQRKISKTALTGAIVLCSFIISLLCTSRAGMYWVNFFDYYSAGTALLFVVLLEAVGISWFYGDAKFAQNIEEMIGHKPNLYWRICWKYISPILILIMIIYGFVLHVPISLGSYKYPKWTSGLGWGVALLPVAFIPIYVIYYCFFIKRQHNSNK